MSTAYNYHRSELTISRPRHEHDCDACVWHGSVEWYSQAGVQVYDVYFCPGDSTIIARFGVDKDYSVAGRALIESGLCSGVLINALSLVRENERHALSGDHEQTITYGTLQVPFRWFSCREYALVTYADVVSEAARLKTLRNRIAGIACGYLN